MLRLQDTSSDARGTLSMSQLSKRTGYGRPQLKRAIQVLRIKHGKRKRSGFRIPESKVYDIVKYLFDQENRWSKAHNACVECGFTDSKHLSKGRCGRCYKRKFNRLIKTIPPERQRGPYMRVDV